MKGDGWLYRRLKSPFYWMGYYKDGKEVRESTKQTTKTAANEILKSRMKEIKTGTYVAPEDRNRPINWILDRYTDRLEAKGKDVKVVKYQLKPVREAFGYFKVEALKAEHLTAYQNRRLEEGRQPATVNREFEALRAALKLAKARGQVSRIPRFEMLDESENVRVGFVSRAEVDAICEHLPEVIADLTRFGFLTGWRLGALRTLSWADIEFEDGKPTRIAPKQGVNKKNRGVVEAAGEIREIVLRRLERRRVAVGEGVEALSAFVFHRNGREIKDFRHVWKAAREKSGVNLIFHDLRRSAVREMVRAGVHRTVAMQISGHRSAAMFDRYDITAPEDIRKAIQAREAYMKENPGTIKIVKTE